MPVDRFYLNAPLREKLLLEGTEHHHAAHVLRLKGGETVEIVNGKGELAQAKIESIQKHSIELWVQNVITESSPLAQLHLGIPLMRSSKLEWVVEKATELGASSFFFYTADHSEKDSLSDHQLERLRLITISAMKQSGRLFLPSIELASHLSDCLKIGSPLYFGDTSPKAPFFRSQGNALFITGPERGFSDKEETLLRQKGEGVKLSPYILRAETAPLAAATLFALI